MAVVTMLRAADRLLNPPKRVGKVKEVPPGFTLLPAGKVKQIRVNQDYIKGDDSKGAFLLIYEGDVFNYSQIEMLGKCRMGSSMKGGGCGGEPVKGSAWVQTTGPVLVKK